MMFDRIRLGTLMFICVAVPFIGCGSANDIDSIVVTPATFNFGGAGLSGQLRAIATIGHGAHPATTVDVTDRVIWTTDGSGVATVSSTGLVTSGIDIGTVQISASIHGFTGLITSSATINVTAPTSTVKPNDSTPLAIVNNSRTAAELGETRQLRAVRTSGSSGVQEDLTDGVVWSSSDPAVATVSKSGFVTGVSRGTTTIVATATNPDKTVTAVAVGFTVAE
jgi:hypothetical protein